MKAEEAVSDNRYAPPKAEVEGSVLGSESIPALWNPNAAVNWSLLFPLMFGMWLHMLNWRELGENERAESAKTWLLLTTLIIVSTWAGGLLMPYSGLLVASRVAYLGLLLAWYFGSARGQANWVSERCGKSYQRRGWTQPLLGALVLVIASSIVFAVLASLGASLLRS